MLVIKFLDGTLKAFGHVEKFTLSGDSFYIDYVNGIKKYDSDYGEESYCTDTEFVDGKMRNVEYIMIDGRKVYQSDEEV